MTVWVLCERSLDGNREATVEFDKFGPFKARVYERIGNDWHQTHESTPTWDKDKAIAAYERFVKKYIV